MASRFCAAEIFEIKETPDTKPRLICELYAASLAGREGVYAA
jgi:hypothetical protein